MLHDMHHSPKGGQCGLLCLQSLLGRGVLHMDPVTILVQWVEGVACWQ